MMRPMRSAVELWLATALVLAFAGLAAAASTEKLRVLVTNDDGVAAQGISDLVDALAANPELEVFVYAPATNQSGTGENITMAPINVTDTTTLGGYPAKSVAGFPADSVLFGVLEGLASDPPDLVVSGINLGQNPGPLVKLSGTVGAAIAAARLGIPAIAASQALGAGLTYTEQAQYIAELVETLRTKRGRRAGMFVKQGVPQALVLNVNFPTCTAGSLRGVRVVPLGQTPVPTGYNSLGGTSWQLTTQSVGYGSNDCTSTLEDPQTDLEALNNGFASVTPLQADLTVASRLARFRWAGN